VQRLLTRWLLASSVILVAVIPVTVLLTVAGAGDLSIGPAQYSVAKYSVAPDGGVSLSVDINVVIVAGLLFALVSLLLVPRMRRRPPSGNPAAPHPVFLQLFPDSSLVPYS
jgi:hypothetical protein